MYILDAIRTRCLNFRYFMSYKKSFILLILLFVCSEDAFSQNLNASVVNVIHADTVEYNDDFYLLCAIVNTGNPFMILFVMLILFLLHPQFLYNNLQFLLLINILFRPKFSFLETHYL